MQIVIDIDEEDYKGICHLRNEQLRMLPVEVAETLIRIANGTLLPKGHGRLIDADEIQFENAEFDTYSDYSRAFDAIDQADTIIEKDGD